jgi:hypothetical protein
MASAADPSPKRARMETATVAATKTSKEDAKELLLSVPSYTLDLTFAFSQLEFISLHSMTRDLLYIKTMQPLPNRTKCGLQIYSMDLNLRNIDLRFLGIEMRDSKFLYERKHYDSLYQQILRVWEAPKKIILTGSSGIGKSLFQIYLLRRLLNEKDKTYRFLVQQCASAFYLFDVETCQGWKLRGDHDDIVNLLESLDNSLYLFDPGAYNNADRLPLSTLSRTISFLPPRPSPIWMFQQHTCPIFLYIPG